MKKEILNRFLGFISIITFLNSCGSKNEIGFDKVDVLHQNQDKLTEVIIYDIFTPPVAARIYVYSSLASYEAIRFLNPGNPSMAEKMNGFDRMPLPDSTKEYDYTLAATKAFFTVAHKVIFSIDTLMKYEKPLLGKYKKVLKDFVYNRSIAFGDTIGKIILARAVKDNYLQSRGKPKYLGSEEPGKWRPTPPDYMDGVEYCWNEMQPVIIDSASQFLPTPPPEFDMNPNSQFFKAMKEVYDVNKNLTEEQKTIARFWDDNPFVIEHSGHMMMGNKKITPGGHWMGIAAIAAKQTKADAIKTAKTYALTAAALFDAFISCWDAKYKWNYIRPITAINNSIDKTWTSLLQTPPFPEYTSGHSTITAAAAVILTNLYGDNFSYEDTSDLKYIGMKRSFNSFFEAAMECSMSRLYGGIHYRFSVDKGNEYGKKIGYFIVNKLELQ